MFVTALSMLENFTEAYIEEDTKIARKVFKKDRILNAINIDSFGIISKEVKETPEIFDQ